VGFLLASVVLLSVIGSVCIFLRNYSKNEMEKLFLIVIALLCFTGGLVMLLSSDGYTVNLDSVYNSTSGITNTTTSYTISSGLSGVITSIYTILLIIFMLVLGMSLFIAGKFMIDVILKKVV